MPSDPVSTRWQVHLQSTIAGVPFELEGQLEREEAGGTRLARLYGAARVELELRKLVDAWQRDGVLGDDVVQALDRELPAPLREARLQRFAVAYNAQPELLQGSLSIVLGAAGDTHTAGQQPCIDAVVIKSLGAGAEAASGFAIGVELRLGDQPPLQSFLSPLLGDIRVRRLAVYYANRPFARVPFYPDSAATGFASLLDPPEPAQDALPKGFRVFADVSVGNANLIAPSASSEAGAPQASVPASDPPAATPMPDDGMLWIQADKEIGPISVRRVGLGYKESRVLIKLDAALQLSCLSFTLDGLGLSYPIDKLTPDPREIWEHLRFHLDGASLTFGRGPLTISGGMLKVQDEPLELFGSFMVSTPLFCVAAIGAYTTVKPVARGDASDALALATEPSFFLFASLRKDLGGPTFFYVRGLALGFGIHRKLSLPPITEVHRFPLVRAVLEEHYLGAKLDLRAISGELAPYVAPSQGDYWLAAGVRFTTFEIIDSFVLLSVAFGSETVIGVVGLSKLSLPKDVDKDSRAIAHAELAIKVVFRPELGVLKAEGRLTPNSYLFDESCRLFGGFAFYAWFKDCREGEHLAPAGDFVITLGGYHPRFEPPAHYPIVPRIGFDWVIPPSVRISGECYFALTPTCVMAGGRLSVVYEEGRLRAWFVAYADFLIAWQPLHYEARVGVRLGACYRLELGASVIPITIELGAEAEIWGPPFAGRVEIYILFFSVTVYLGEGRHGRKVPRPLKWEEFARACLPKGDADGTKAQPLSIVAVAGVIDELKLDAVTEPIVNPLQLQLIAKSAVPSATVGLFNEEHGNAPSVGIRPMDMTDLRCELRVKIHDHDGKPVNAFQWTPERQNLPKALWGTTPLDPKQGPEPAELIQDALTGVRLECRLAKPGVSLHARTDHEEIAASPLRWVYETPQQGTRTKPDEKDWRRLRDAVLDRLQSTWELAEIDAGESSQPWWLELPQPCGLAMYLP